MTQGRVLFIDDDATLRRVMARDLTRIGFTVHTLDSGDGAVEALREQDPEVAVLDLDLPGRSGLETLGQLREADPDLQVVVLTSQGSAADVVQAMRDGAHDFLTKPVSTEVVEQAVLRALEKRRLLAENQRLRRAVQASGTDAWTIVGDSAAIQRLRDEIARLAPDDGHVLIQGEDGTGKELVARNIHRHSPRRDQPFVVVDCGAIPAHLIESELFGHEGTGADRPRTGWLEAASGGTLFLDEVGDLPQPVQAALLQAIQSGEFRAVGGTRGRKASVRVLAATSRDLHHDVAVGRFRQDLHQRLATQRLDVPALRDRAEDVPLLAKHFLQTASKRNGRELVLDETALTALTAWQWPGNLRELEAVITRLSVLSPTEQITGDTFQQYGLGTPPPAGGELPSLRVDELERLAIIRALERTTGDKRKAAELLGIALRTLYNKLEVYGLKPAPGTPR